MKIPRAAVALAEVSKDYVPNRSYLGMELSFHRKFIYYITDTIKTALRRILSSPPPATQYSSLILFSFMAAVAFRTA
jgi:hypothetical protein